MSFIRSNCSHLRPRSSFFLPENPIVLHRNFQIREFRIWKRRRLKIRRNSTVSNGLRHSFENLFQNMISQLPLMNSLHLIAPAIGFASSLALYLSRRKASDSENSNIGNWILFTSPTPFNRFVLLRCPSIDFEDSELLEGLNEKLVKEERHFVNLNRGSIEVSERRDGGFEDNLVYQRICISADDGGVISLDWPANLDLTKEHGLDTTLLLVPGTAEGSMDRNIRSFVCESLRNGCFPIVMNPRGCAGSPLTTARLFTAADSDDISTAIQFINRSRPWTTLMSIGWGYGANMLTKYLGEVEERTPLTAAACIDNPFDLEEATRSFPHHIALDQKLTGGLIDILCANKSDDGTVPLISIPRSSIAENPFTSLLLCSCMPASTITKERSAIPWCQSLVIEWLAAVELALLKGRHPLLKDVDVTINPSKDLVLVEGRPSDKKISTGNGVPSSYDPSHSYLSYKDENVDLLLNHTQLGVLNGFSADRNRNVLAESANQVSNKVGVNLETRDNPLDSERSQVTQTVDADLVKEGGDNPLESERSQVTQTAEFVMNMLDVTMPGTLADEQKRKVLTAVEQGETFTKALQGAVPEDVRQKLTSAVSEIVRSQGLNLNPGNLMRDNLVANVTTDVKSKIQEKFQGISSANDGDSNSHSSDNMMKGAGPEKMSSQGETLLDSKEMMREDLAYQSSDDDLSGEMANNQSNLGKPSMQLGSEIQPSSKLQTSLDLGNPQLEGGYGGDMIAAGMRDSNEAEQNYENVEFSQDKSTEACVEESGPEKGKTNHQNRTEHEVPSSNVLLSPEPSLMEKQGNDIQKNEDKNVQAMSQSSSAKADEPSPPLSSPSSLPSISVSQALDALTGFDDSTQMAVNSVFGVIENMIDEFEKENNPSDVGQQNENEDAESTIASNEPPVNSKYGSENKENTEDGLSIQSDVMWSYDNPVNNSLEECAEPHQNFGDELGRNKPMSNLKTSVMDNIGRSQGNDIASSQLDMEDKNKQENLIDSTGFTENSNGVGHVQSFPLQIAVNPYGGLPYKESLHKYFPSKMSNTKFLDLDSTTDLFLEYFPEEGQWKLLDQLEDPPDSMYDAEAPEGVNRDDQNIHSPLQVSVGESILEPSYVILDTELQHQPTEECDISDDLKNEDKKGDQREATNDEASNEGDRFSGKKSETEKDHHQLLGKNIQYADLDSSVTRGSCSKKPETANLNKDSAMVGAVTAAVGASALLVHRNGKDKCHETTETSSIPISEKRNPQKEHDNLEEALQERNQNNIVTSLAEKAMSVAGPVVPTKSDGEVDQERVVAMLADLGQKGGMLSSIGKIALLWGGMRGAMSLTDRLILFLGIAERPLFQRILGFVCMVLVLWSPLVIPLLPTIVHNWAKQRSTGIAEYACIIGLYPAVMILVMLWGKRIRGYSNPLEQYGLDVTSSPKLHDFLKGLMGGLFLVLSVHSINVLLGFAYVVRPSGLPSSPAGAIMWLKGFGRMLLLAAKGIVPATGVAVVEELLFRSWLPEEIATDLGYHRAIIISGLAFSLLQRSLPAVPGLWLLSLALAGVKQRGQGHLSVPIGVRTGALSATFILQAGGLLTYRPDAPFWVTGSQPWQPFGGAVGLVFCIILAVLFYPRQPLQRKNISRVIRK
ncbi:uncharacterized protein LOC143877983 isoform X2 [Tasmannia lanceolata]|uniref:uncharacterized protein LOC143877983 isoform X2 n=1 Tax=Tasmannia lanceolata TaxID=3420 RepID=UPI004064BBAF